MKVPQIGDSVKMKKGHKIPFNKTQKVDGWQGRIIKIFDEACLCCGHKKRYFTVEFDSITLRQMTEEHINMLLDDGDNFAHEEFLIHEITVVEPRDTIEETKAVRQELYKKYDFEPFY
jgi:hypothetical protein